MTRRAWRWGLVAVLMCGGIWAGCGGSHRCFLRRPVEPRLTPLEGLTTPEAGPNDLTADLEQQAHGVARAARRSGAWSREAAAIEANLGVRQ